MLTTIIYSKHDTFSFGDGTKHHIANIDDSNYYIVFDSEIEEETVMFLMVETTKHRCFIELPQSFGEHFDNKSDLTMFNAFDFKTISIEKLDKQIVITYDELKYAFYRSEYPALWELLVPYDDLHKLMII